jgi:hypothetical protein
LAQFKSYDAKTEVLGDSVMAFVDAFPSEMKVTGLKILKDHGIENPQAGEWFSLQNWLDAMKDIGDKFGDMILRKIGEQIARNAKLPPGLETVEQFLGVIDDAYHMNYRNGEIGHYSYQEERIANGIKTGKMVITSPFPCAYDWGVLEGFGSTLKTESGGELLIRIDESAERRSSGADSTTYLLTWA